MYQFIYIYIYIYITYSDHLFDVMANIIIKNNLNIFKKYNCYLIYYAYGTINVNYLESLLNILIVLLLFFFLIMITIIKCILSYLILYIYIYNLAAGTIFSYRKIVSYGWGPPLGGGGVLRKNYNLSTKY